MSGPVVRQGAEAGAARIRLFLTDVDGVLTDGGILYDSTGVETKRFDVRDGHGIKMLQRGGVAVGIITGRTSEVVAIRARELGIDIVRQGVKDKVAAWREILAGSGFLPTETAYVGDDIVDLPLLRVVGFSAA
ncbi:MAG TPA: phenylphosphate carboxylase subunit delta, partial [Deferrimonas sp.]